MIKKISLPVLITILCVMLFGVGGLYYFNLKNKKKVSVSTEPKISRTDYSAVARKTLDWIDQQRNADGWYILERGCDYQKKTCDVVWDNDEGNKDGLIATWARFNFYQQTKDPKDLEIVKSDINKFYEKYPNGVDNALWICKITYEMWKSNLFDQDTKDKLEKICFESKTPDLLSSSKEYQIWRDKDIKILSNDSLSVYRSWKGYSLTLRSFDSYFGTVSDLIARYHWHKDNSDLKKANEYFVSIKGIFDADSNNINANNMCLFGLSGLDLYEFGDRQSDVSDYVSEKYSYLSDPKGNIKELRTAVCGLMTKRLLNLTDNDLFLDSLEKNNKVMVKNLLDANGSVGEVIGDGGFFVTGSGSLSFLFKDVAENGLIVELLRN